MTVKEPPACTVGELVLSETSPTHAQANPTGSMMAIAAALTNPMAQSRSGRVNFSHPRFLVAEAQKEHPTTRLQDRRQSLDIAPAVSVAEDMEQTAVDDVVKLLVPVRERQGILDQEGDRHAPLGSLALRPLDRHFKEIDPGDLAAAAGEEESGLARAAAGVENGAGDPVGDLDECLLRLADVPGRLAGIGGLESGAVG